MFLLTKENYPWYATVQILVIMHMFLRGNNFGQANDARKLFRYKLPIPPDW
jgi:hypothetical protein